MMVKMNVKLKCRAFFSIVQLVIRRRIKSNQQDPRSHTKLNELMLTVSTYFLVC